MRGERAILDEPEYREIVGQSAGGGDDFHEIRLENFNPVGRLFEALGAAKVVKANQQAPRRLRGVW